MRGWKKKKKNIRNALLRRAVQKFGSKDLDRLRETTTDEISRTDENLVPVILENPIFTSRGQTINENWSLGSRLGWMTLLKQFHCRLMT